MRHRLSPDSSRSTSRPPPRRRPSPTRRSGTPILAARARDGGFDYRGATGQDSKRLAAYLANLGDADPKAMARDERKAFFINAYNAMAIAIVLERYPVQEHPRRRRGVQVDPPEDRRRDAHARRRREPAARHPGRRASISRSSAPRSPVRRSRRGPTRPAGLAAALDAQGRAFVGDPSKNVARPRRAAGWRCRRSSTGIARSSSGTAGRSPRYVARFVAEPAAGGLGRDVPGEPEFLEYDWALNQP